MNYQKNLFFKIKELLDENEIEFFLFAGTALGAIRNKRFISWDKEDMDLGLFAKDYEKVKHLLLKSNWKIKAIWRREISIYKEEKNGEPVSYVDLFFFDEDETNMYCYIYGDNPLNNFYDIELQFKYPKELILPLGETKFFGKEVKIPGQVEKYFEYHYLNWEIPNQGKEFNYRRIKPTSYKQIAIIIPTFLRDEKLVELVESIKSTFDGEFIKKWFKLYIGDQGRESTPEKEIYYKQLIDEGHEIFKLPYNCGLSAARNYLVKQTKEPFILVVDDDFLFTEKSNLSPFINILVDNSEIGLVGGPVSERQYSGGAPYVFNLEYDQKNRALYLLKKDKEPILTTPTLKQPSTKYILADIVLNFFLARRELFDNILWDENLKMAEHTDFFLRLKFLNKWKVAYTEEISVSHNNKPNSSQYTAFRDPKTGTNCTDGIQFFLKKWGLDSPGRAIYTELEYNNVKRKTRIITHPLNVAKTIDVFGWAYYFIAKEMQKYSLHNISYKKFTDKEWDNLDILYISSPGFAGQSDMTARYDLPLLAKEKNIKVIGGYSGEVNINYEHADLICTISPQLYKRANIAYPNTPVIFLPESIDTLFFIPGTFDENRFKVGWAGGLGKEMKRDYLFPQFNYEVTKQCDNGPKFWTEDRTSEPMRNFYHSIDCFVLPSNSECMPRVVMEAMACGLPVIACDVGSIRLLLDPEWIVPVEPDELVVEEFNKKLKQLHDNPELRKQVGIRNRQHVQQYYSWLSNQILWDNVFTWFYNNDYIKIMEQNEQLISNFIKIYPELYNKEEILRHRCSKFFKELNYQKIKYYLLKNSCLEAVILKKLETLPISFGTFDKKDEERIKSIAQQFNLSVETIIERGTIMRKTKPFILYDTPIIVPMPVVEYLYYTFGKENLINQYGEDWRK